MLTAIFALVLAIGIASAGWNYVSVANRMRAFRSVPGRIVHRDVVATQTGGRESALGSGGAYTPYVRFRYVVDGAELEADKIAFATRGWKRSLAAQELAKIPDDIVVWYNPTKPTEAFLRKHTPTLGYFILALGAFGALCAGGYLLTRAVG